MKPTKTQLKQPKYYGLIPLALFILGIIIVMIVLKLIFKNL